MLKIVAPYFAERQRMNLIPESWIDNGRMKRIVCHWTAGAHKASDLDRSHYHILIEDDGELVRGFHSIAANESASDGTYAAHTRGTNSGAIGIAVCCMAGAEERPFRPGRFPMTKVQWTTMAQVAGELCRAYKIPVSPTTVLGHGEVQRNLGIAQRGKWDPMVLPWESGLSAREVGDAFRALVAAELEGQSDAAPASPVKAKLKGVELAETVSDNEDTLIKVSELLRALSWSVVGAEVSTALFAGPDGGQIYLPHQSLGDGYADPASSDDAVEALLVKDGFVSVRDLAEALSLNVSFDVASGTLEVGGAAGEQGEAVPKPPRTVTVKSGDTLSHIAERYLGSAAKWRLLRKKDLSSFTEKEARHLRLGDVVVLPDAAPPAGTAAQPAAARIDGIDIDAVVGAAETGLAQYARVSIPLLVAECQAQGVVKPAHIAYVLATSEHESKCGKFMRELWGPTAAQRRYEGRADLGNDRPGDGFLFRGRGYAQITGRANYQTWAGLLQNPDIVRKPDVVAQDQQIAARIMVMAMRDGKFRGGHSLSKFLDGAEPDFFNAREIINGDKRIVDQGQASSRGNRIAAIAERYLAALEEP